MKREVREQLNSLSKQVFGTASKWKSLVDKGTLEPMERQRTVMVPSSKGPVEKTFTDRKNVVRRYSVDEIRGIMFELLAERNKNTLKDQETKDAPKTE